MKVKQYYHLRLRKNLKKLEKRKGKEIKVVRLENIQIL